MYNNFLSDFFDDFSKNDKMAFDSFMSNNVYDELDDCEKKQLEELLAKHRERKEHEKKEHENYNSWIVSHNKTLNKIIEETKHYNKVFELIVTNEYFNFIGNYMPNEKLQSLINEVCVDEQSTRYYIKLMKDCNVGTYIFLIEDNQIISKDIKELFN